MEQLLLRLSTLDAVAENSLRVIGFFDELIAQRVPLRLLVSQTARLAECPAGVTDPRLGVSLRAEPSGDVESQPGPHTPATIRALDDGGSVWLERAGEPLALDDILLERFAIAASVVLGHAHGPSPDGAESAPLKVILAGDLPEGQRARAMGQLGLTASDRIRILAVIPAPDERDVLAALEMRAPGVRASRIGGVHAVLARASVVQSLKPRPGTLVGIGREVRGMDAQRSWLQAKTALRFASPEQTESSVVVSDELGALGVIADRMRAQDIAQIADVDALDRLAEDASGQETLTILDALCRTGSARKAATALFRHHSTVLTRITHAESQLGFAFGSPAGRIRLELALILRRLRNTAEQDHAN